MFLASYGHFILDLPRIRNKTTKNSQIHKIPHNFFKWPQNEKLRPLSFLQFLKIKTMGYVWTWYDVIWKSYGPFVFFGPILEGIFNNFWQQGPEASDKNFENWFVIRNIYVKINHVAKIKFPKKMEICSPILQKIEKTLIKFGGFGP